MTHRMSARVAELTSARVPFVHATVVRAAGAVARPGPATTRSSSPTGAIEGFVGGQCAEGSVRAAALDSLATGESLLLRVLPDGGEHFPESPERPGRGEPLPVRRRAGDLPRADRCPLRCSAVVGSTPITDALVMMAGPLGFVGRRARARAGPAAVPPPSSSPPTGTARRRRSGPRWTPACGFVGLVASPTRGREVLAVDRADRRRARPGPDPRRAGHRCPHPGGDRAVDPGRARAGSTPGRAPPLPPGEPTDVPQQVIDPVCGMTVVVGPDTPHYRDADGDHWFCATGCRDTYAAAHPT